MSSTSKTLPNSPKNQPQNNKTKARLISKGLDRFAIRTTKATNPSVTSSTTPPQAKKGSRFFNKSRKTSSKANWVSPNYKGKKPWGVKNPRPSKHNSIPLEPVRVAQIRPAVPRVRWSRKALAARSVGIRLHVSSAQPLVAPHRLIRRVFVRYLQPEQVSNIENGTAAYGHAESMLRRTFYTVERQKLQASSRMLLHKGKSTKNGKAQGLIAANFISRKSRGVQMVRKLRALHGKKTRKLVRRLARFLYRNRKKFTKLRFKKRIRLRRRTARRASRYAQASSVILSAAHQKLAARRALSRRTRLRFQQAIQALSRLIRVSSTRTVQSEEMNALAARQLLLSQLHQQHKRRALALSKVKACFLASFPRAKARRNWLKCKTASSKLRRRVLRRALLTSQTTRGQAGLVKNYRVAPLLQRRTAVRVSAWLRTREQRVQRKRLFDKKYLTTPYNALFKYIANRRIRQLANRLLPALITSTQGVAGTRTALPRTFSRRYRELTRRLKFKKIASTSVGPNLAGALQNCATKVATFRGVYWRPISRPNTSLRFRLSTVGRNLALRERASASTQRYRARSTANVVSVSNNREGLTTKESESTVARMRPAPLLTFSPYLTNPASESTVSHQGTTLFPKRRPLPSQRKVAKLLAYKGAILEEFPTWDVRPSFAQLLAEKRTRSYKAPVTSSRAAVIALRAQRTSFLEKKFYRRRVKLRLPKVRVRRREARRGGARLFARNSLKKPQTWLGERNLLLPVASPWGVDKMYTQLSAKISMSDLRPVHRFLSKHPRVWRRGPGFHDSGLVFDARERRSRVRSAKIRRQQSRKPKKVSPEVVASRQAAIKQLDVFALKVASLTTGTFLSNCHSRKTASLTIAQGDLLKHAVLAKINLQRSKLNSVLRRSTQRNTSDCAEQSLGRVVTRTALRSSRVSNAVKKQKALWHVRSVRSMLERERSLSAWAPQYPLKWRRWSAPRRQGLPLPRHWVSKKVARQRASTNAARSYRGLPKRRYFDHAYGHLQFYRGSAASVGYARFRRAHRSRSLKNNRWWKPVTYPVPFAHPYSRRSLNSKKATVRRLARKMSARGGDKYESFWGLKGKDYRVAFPARKFPSRNFEIVQRHWESTAMWEARVKEERAKMPVLLQRWGMRLNRFQVGVPAAPRHRIALSHTRRARRKLEKLFPRSAVWADRRWEQLDSVNASSSMVTIFTEACKTMSKQFWASFQHKAGNPSAALKLKKQLFSHFCQWAKFALHPRISTTQLTTAVKYIAATASNLLLVDKFTLEKPLQSSQRTLLSKADYARRVARKKDRFWTMRELPRLKKGVLFSENILSKTNSALYKRWLRGAEGYLKRSRSSHLAPSRGRLGLGRTLDLGRSRRRFPASGRRRHSYDSMLHAFAKRTSPARFRRASTLRFIPVRVKVNRSYKVNLQVHASTRTQRRQRKLARKLGRVAYLSPVWRELLSYRSNSPLTASANKPAFELEPEALFVRGGTEVSATSSVQCDQAFASLSKRRFASLPVNALFKRAQSTRRSLRMRNAIPLRTQRIALLRGALRRRRLERVYLDLKKHTLRRRLPKDQLPLPWKARKAARRHEKYVRFGNWSLPHFNASPSKDLFWTLHDLEERVPRRRDRARLKTNQTYYGELLALPRVKAKRAPWAKKGFCIQLKKRKAHRCARRAKKRRRRTRSLLGQAGRVRFRHWSERKHYKFLSAPRKEGLAALRKTLHGRLDRAKASAKTLARVLSVTKISPRKDRACFKRSGADLQGEHLQQASLPSKHIVQGSCLLSTVRKTVRGAHQRLHVAFSSQVLPRFSSTRLAKSVSRLKRRAAYRRNKFARRIAHISDRNTRSTQTHSDAVVSARTQAAQALRRFTEHLDVTSVVAPLTFQLPTKVVVKSEAEKRQAVIWNIQSKEARYKRTAQYAEAVTAFVPALINHMISRRTNTRKLTYTNVKNLIHSTYWNLRVYLNVDPFEKRLALRDNNPLFLRTLASNLSDLAKAQITEHADRMHLRRRFQPSKLHPAPTSDRFRLDWLRSFFPKKHALFQEDPEEYASIPVSTMHIRRLIPSGFGIARWRTAPGSAILERRARQLLRLRYSRCAPRFETVLQSTRRVPLSEVSTLLPAPMVEESVQKFSHNELAEESNDFARSKKIAFEGKVVHKKSVVDYAAARNLAYILQDRAETPRTPFFRRAFSTQAIRVSTALARYISLRNRLIAHSQVKESNFFNVAARYRLKARLVARGRTHFTAHAHWMLDSGSLDPRFLRYKSPRSRQYFIRTPSSIIHQSDQEKLIKLIAYRALRRRHKRASHEISSGVSLALVSRSVRRYYYNELVPTVRSTAQAALQSTRAKVSTRRLPTFLNTRKNVVRTKLQRTRRYNFPNRQQYTFTSPTLQRRLVENRVEAQYPIFRSLQSNQHFSYIRKTYGQQRLVENARSVLQYRTAAQRTSSFVYKSDRVIPSRALYKNYASWRAGRFGRRAMYQLSRLATQKEDAELATLLPAANKHRTLRFAELSSYRLRVASDRLCRFQQRRKKLSQKTARSSSRYALPYAGFNFKFSTNFLSRRLKSPHLDKKLSIVSRFTNRSYERYAARAYLTNIYARLEKQRYAMPFDTYRPQLWHDLTHRWMKKERLMRDWLKEVKRWFRDPWLSELVDVNRTATKNLAPGEIRAREQQVGELVDGDENAGFTEEEDAARQEAAKPAIEKAEKEVRADQGRRFEQLRSGSAHTRQAILLRGSSPVEYSKPRPTLWLANLQAAEKTLEMAEWRQKTRPEKDAIRLERKQAAIARAAKGLAPLPPKKPPFKMPADFWMPSFVWKEIQRRARRLEWRESDDVFTRKGFRTGFKFFPNERNRAPWLEALMFNRSLFSTRLGEFRRRQFPREQKKYKWLQRVRKSFFPGRTHTYIRWRRWPRLRSYNQRLHYTLFNLPDRNAARRHFKKLNRRSRKVGFVHAQEGLSNRLDNVLVHLNIAPTIFWARTVAPFGLLRVNGKIVSNSDYRLQVGDFIEPVWKLILRFRHFFEPPLTRREELTRHRRFSVGAIPRNFKYYPGVRCFVYLGNPRESELRRSSRLQPHLFRWFKLDSV